MKGEALCWCLAETTPIKDASEQLIEPVSGMSSLLILAQPRGGANLGNDPSANGIDCVRLTAHRAILKTTLAKEHRGIALRVHAPQKEVWKRASVALKTLLVDDAIAYQLRHLVSCCGRSGAHGTSCSRPSVG